MPQPQQNPTHSHLPCDLGATAAPSFLTAVPATAPLMSQDPYAAEALDFNELLKQLG
jgi:hypothetical protein